MRKIGQVFKPDHNEELYILVMTKPHEVQLINLNTGRPWTYPVSVSHVQRIGEIEWSHITSQVTFEEQPVIYREIPNQLIDDILCAALEGGINYWVESVHVMRWGDAPEGTPKSDLISKGATLGIKEIDTGEIYALKKEMVIKGIRMFTEIQRMFEDASDLDAGDADAIIQYAIFDELVYG